MSQQQAVDPGPYTPPKRRRRRLFWVVAVFALFVLWLAVMYAFFVYWMNRDLRAAMAAADRDNPGGWKLEDIEAHREQVPDEENAALVAMKVKSLLPAAWPRDMKSPDSEPAEKSRDGLAWDVRLDNLPPEVQLDVGLLRRLRESLARVEPAQTEARKLTGMTRGRFPIQWGSNIFQTKLNSQDARTATRLLRYEATLAAQDGDVERALAFVRGILGAARAVGDEPFLISALVRFACDAQAVQALERALAQGEPSQRELEAVQALLEKEAAEPIFLRAVRGERGGLHKLLLSIEQGTMDLSELEWLESGSPARRPRRNFIDYLSPTLARYGHPLILDLMNQYVEAAKLPPEKQPPVMNQLEQKVRKARARFDIVTALLIPAISKVSNVYIRNLGSLRCATVALALERFRRDHGRWPDTLDALVPNYLSAVPNDPQDGKPLRFKHRPDGVIVYWIGPDGKDDGGKLNRRNPWTPGTDQGFQLWDVKHRRRPAQELLPQPAVKPSGS
jgi:hypothetical protein